MDQFLNMGKSFLNKSGGGHSKGGGGGDHAKGGFGNPIAMFKQLDNNGDGKITEEDFVASVHSMGLGSVGEHAVRAIFKKLDTNHNGKLDVSEALVALEHVKKLFESQGGKAAAGH